MNESTPQNLFNLLVSKDYTVKTLDANGKEQSDLKEVEMFSFDFEVNNKNFGTVVILLNSEGQMEIFYADAIGNSMDAIERKVWSDLLYQLRIFAKRNMMGFQIQNINKLKYSMQSMASMNESFKNIFESYYGTKKTSYSPQGNARIIIKHSKNIGEEDKRYRNISSIFIENADGERFKLPFKKLNGARAMARHVTEGGNPYDIFGLHITEMVKDIGTLGGFMRRSKIFAEDDETRGLVETGGKHYASMRKGLKQIAGKRGYHTYKESWKPAEITETELDVSNIRKMFTEKSLNQHIDNALPLLARLSENMDDVDLQDVVPVEEDRMPESMEFESWVHDLVQEELPNQDEDIDALRDFFSKEQPAGIDALNVTDALYNILGDNHLFDQLGQFADENPDSDTRPIVADWISNNSPELAHKLNLHGEYDNTSARDFPREGLGEEKDLDTDEQCLTASKDENLTDKGDGMEPFKDYVEEAEVENPPQEVNETVEPPEEDFDLTSLIQRTNILLQK